MNKLIVKNCFLPLCFFFGWWSQSAAETPEDRLVKNLKGLFVIESKYNVNPKEDYLLDRLVRDSLLKDLSGVKSITDYRMRDPSQKIGRGNKFGFAILEFDNNDNAKLCLDGLLQIVRGGFEKPPRLFFIASNKLYEFNTRYDYNRHKLFLAAHKLIDCCFSKPEIYFPCPEGYRRSENSYCTEEFENKFLYKELLKYRDLHISFEMCSPLSWRGWLKSNTVPVTKEGIDSVTAVTIAVNAAANCYGEGITPIAARLMGNSKEHWIVYIYNRNETQCFDPVKAYDRGDLIENIGLKLFDLNEYGVRTVKERRKECSSPIGVLVSKNDGRVLFMEELSLIVIAAVSRYN